VRSQLDQLIALFNSFELIAQVNRLMKSAFVLAELYSGKLAESMIADIPAVSLVSGKT